MTVFTRIKRFGEIVKGKCVLCNDKQITDGWRICNDCLWRCEVCGGKHK